MALEVMVCVPDVAPNVVALEDAVSVIPVDRVNDPYTVAIDVAPHVPAYPVKSTFFAVCKIDDKNVSAYVPAVKLNDMELASLKAPEDTVVATAPEFEILTTGVPVTVNPVTVAVVQRVPPAPLQVMVPEPKAKVRVAAPAD